jgi:hypothetical protein
MPNSIGQSLVGACIFGKFLDVRSRMFGANDLGQDPTGRPGTAIDFDFVGSSRTYRVG